jgi:EmrB/QacA subfamily drug resistance transporter
LANGVSIEDAVTKRIALLISTLSAFVTPFGASSIVIALPSIGKEFGMDAILLSWAVTAYLLASTIFLVPFGKIADIFGRKKVFTYGTVTFTIASFALSLSQSSGAFIFLRIVQGLGAAVTFGIGMAILVSVYPVKERGKMLGINVAAVYVGLSFGPFLGGIITQHLGWRYILGVNVLFGLTMIFFVFLKMKGEWAEAKGERFDLTGSVLYSFMLFAITYGFSLLPGTSGWCSILLGGIGVLVLIRWEMKVKNPVLDMNLFMRNRVFAFSSLTALISYSATYAVTFLLSLYLQYIKGLTPELAGWVLVWQPVLQAVISPFTGRLSDRIEPQVVASLGMAVTTLGLLLLTLLGGDTGITYIIACIILLGFGLALFSSPNMNAAMNSIDKKGFGVASAAMNTMRSTGYILSMGIVTSIFSINIGRTQITPAYYVPFLRGMRVAFIVFAVLCFFGILASLSRGKLR